MFRCFFEVLLVFLKVFWPFYPNNDDGTIYGSNPLGCGPRRPFHTNLFQLSIYISMYVYPSKSVVYYCKSMYICVLVLVHISGLHISSNHFVSVKEKSTNILRDWTGPGNPFTKYSTAHLNWFRIFGHFIDQYNIIMVTI